MWEPKESDIKWLRNVFSMVKDGGVWVVPKTNQLFIKSGNAFVYRKKNTECMVEQEREADMLFKIRLTAKAAGIEMREE
jgi:hypothetical protein